MFSTQNSPQIEYEYYPTNFLTRDASFIRVMQKEENNTKREVGTYKSKRTLGSGSYGIVSQFEFEGNVDPKELGIPKDLAVKKPRSFLFQFEIMGRPIESPPAFRLGMAIKKETDPSTVYFVYDPEKSLWHACLWFDFKEYQKNNTAHVRNGSDLHKELEKLAQEEKQDYSELKSLLYKEPRFVRFKPLFEKLTFHVSKKKILPFDDVNLTSHFTFLLQPHASPTIGFIWNSRQQEWVANLHIGISREVPKNSALEKQLENKDDELERIFVKSELFTKQELQNQFELANNCPDHPQDQRFIKAYQMFREEWKAWPHVTQTPALFFSIKDTPSEEKVFPTFTAHSGQKDQITDDPIASGFHAFRLGLTMQKGIHLGVVLNNLCPPNSIPTPKIQQKFILILIALAEKIKPLHEIEKYIHGDISMGNVLIDGDINNDEKIIVNLIDSGRSQKMGERVITWLKKNFNRRHPPELFVSHNDEIVLSNSAQDIYQFTWMITDLWERFFNRELTNDPDTSFKNCILAGCEKNILLRPDINKIILALQQKLKKLEKIPVLNRLGFWKKRLENLPAEPARGFKPCCFL